MVAAPILSPDLVSISPVTFRRAEPLTLSPELTSLMPITANVAQRLDASAFSEALIIHTNHLLDDVLMLNEVFVQLGAQLVFIPVMYGEKRLPAYAPYDLLYPQAVDGEVFIYKNGQPIAGAPRDLDQAVRATIAEAFAQYAAVTNRKVLIVEDGGYHYDALHVAEQLISPWAPGIVAAVEQTRKGVRNAEAHLKRANGRHRYPILSVARSKLKTRFENRFIAQRVIEETTLMLYLLDEFLTYRDVYVIGYGVIGRPLAMIARSMDCRVFVNDIDLAVQRAAVSDGFRVVNSPSPRFFESMPIVIGTTGNPSFTLPMFARFLESAAPRLYLASASSGRIEFSQLIQFFEGAPEEQRALAEQFPFLGWIEDISIDFVKKVYTYAFTYRGQRREVVLFGEGYPINFYRPDSQSLPAKIIDPINAEILVLCEYGLKHAHRLDHRTYLLGQDDLPDLSISEEDILRLWGKQNAIAGLNGAHDVWQTFAPHPCEVRLCGNGRAKANGKVLAKAPRYLEQMLQ